MRSSLLCLIVFLSPSFVFAQSEPTYWQDIRPLFRKHCTVCHQAKNLKELDISGGLALDTYQAAMKGAKLPVIHPGKGQESLLWQLLTTTDKKKRMPLDANPLAKENIELVRRWIDTGAKEGKPLDTVAEVSPGKKTTATRKLEIVLNTTAIPPANLFSKGKAAKLELGLKVGPLAPIAAVAFSPDSKLLAAGNYGQVTLWDLPSGQPTKVLTNVLGAVHDLRFSPDGTLLAVGGGAPAGKGEIRLFQVNDGKLLATLRGHDDVVFSLAFRHDGKKIASGSFDHTVRIWDVLTHQQERNFGGHSDFVYSVAFSPDGQQIASASKDRTVRLVDADTGKSIFTFSGMEQDVLCVAYSPDAKQVVSSGFESSIYYWNPQTGEKLKAQGGHGIAVHELAFSKDGKKLVSAGADRTARTWDTTAGTVLKTFPVGSSVYAVAQSPNGKLIATGSYDGLVKLWDEASARHLATLLCLAGEQEQPDWLILTPEGFAKGSDKMLAQAQWRMANQEIAAERVWSTLRQPEQVRRALQGESVAEVKFAK